jgi:hypothetical protein
MTQALFMTPNIHLKNTWPITARPASNTPVLKERYNRWEDEEEDVSIQWMT